MTEVAAESDVMPVAQDWRQLDRHSIWVGAVKPLVGLLGTGVVFFAVRGVDRMGWVEPAIGALVVVGILVFSAWSWATTRYRVTPTHVELRSGVLVRSERSVARDRLRSVDLTVDVVHRLAGVAVVAIGTGRQGGDADDELKLDSVSTAEAERLRALLLQRRPAQTAVQAGPAHGVAAQGHPAEDTAVDAPGGAPTALAVFDWSWVLLAPLSLLGLIAVGALGAAVGQLANITNGAVFRSRPVQEAFGWLAGIPIPVTVLVGLVVLIVLNSVLSTLLYVLFYGGYSLTRTGEGTLLVSYGLLTRRSVTIEEARIRGVRVDEPLLLRLGGGARCKVVAAGLGVKDSQGNDKRESDLLLPSAPATVAHRVTAAVLGTATSPAAVALRRHPPAALRTLLVRDVPISLVPAVGLAVPAVLGVFPHWPWQLALLLVPISVAFVVLEYRNLGHARSGAFLVARGGSGVRRTVAVRCDGIIAWRFRRSVLQRRPRLLTAFAAVAAGSGAHEIRYAAQDDVLGLAADAVPGLLAPFLEPDGDRA